MKKTLSLVLHLLVLLLSIFLIIDISVDTFQNVTYTQEHSFLKVQFWICVLFLLDFFIELGMAQRKWHYFFTHLFFFFVSIPYLNIFHFFDIQFSGEVTYFLRFIPLLRGGYAMVSMVSWLAKNSVSGLFFSYLTLLISSVYFSTLIFFVFEWNKNSYIHTFSDALWWAFMDVTTVGSNIYAVTVMGKILSVFLAAMGMMTFPIFTVYITNIVQKRQQRERAAKKSAGK